MGTQLQIQSARAIESARPAGRLTDQLAGDVLSDIARTLWPTKTAENVAVCAACTVRAAERYLAGDREWSTDALAAIIAEILRRRAMRNVKITGKSDGGH